MPYSEKLLAFMKDPVNKEIIHELLLEHSEYVNKMRDFREETAKKLGMTYHEYMVFLNEGFASVREV